MFRILRKEEFDDKIKTKGVRRNEKSSEHFMCGDDDSRYV